MPEHGIIFSAPMVRAILANTKTQTRRLKKARKPYSVGDTLWVRESWRRGRGYEYLADYALPESAKWKPSIHMPRSASRILLSVTAVREEPIQAITEADALAEGMTRKMCVEILDRAAGASEMKALCWIEDDESGQSDGENYCLKCAQEEAEKRPGWRVCGGAWMAEESDGPAYCEKCGDTLLMSLSKDGIDRELFLECNDAKNIPCYAAFDRDARIAHMIADGYGDLQDEHLGRLAQIGFATLIDLLHGRGTWKKNPTVYVYQFEAMEAPHA